MIKFFKTWCEGIIVAVMISIIIELLIPDGNNKKYAKVVIGVFIVYVILNPFFIDMDNLSFDFNFSTNSEVLDTSVKLDNNIKDVFIQGIETEIKEKIEELNYEVYSVNVEVDEQYENIEQIEINLKNNEIYIENVVIGENTTNENYVELKKYISENYNIDVSNIFIQ